MLAVNGLAGQANRFRPCIRQAAPSVSLAQWPAGERRDRDGGRLGVPGRSDDGGRDELPECCPTRVSRSRTRSCKRTFAARRSTIVARCSAMVAGRLTRIRAADRRVGQLWSLLIGYGVNRHWVGTSVPVSGCHGCRSEKARFGGSACGKRSRNDRCNDPADPTSRRVARVPVFSRSRPGFRAPSTPRTSRGPSRISIAQAFDAASLIQVYGTVTGR